MFIVIIILLAIVIEIDLVILKRASREMISRISIVMMVIGILALVGGWNTLNNFKQQSFIAENNIKPAINNDKYDSVAVTKAKNEAQKAAAEVKHERELYIIICNAVLISGGIIILNGGMLFISSSKSKNRTEQVNSSINAIEVDEINILKNEENQNGFCQSCGQPVINTAKFCPNCGEKINSDYVSVDVDKNNL